MIKEGSPRGIARAATATLRRAAVLGLAGAVSAPASAQQRTAVPTSLTFDGVTIVDVEQGKLVTDQRVVIRGNRIQAVGNPSSVSIPAGAQVVPAKDKYLIPGLWDMHMHVNDSRVSDDVAMQDSLYREMYPRFVAHGVTGVREMAQRFEGGADSFRVWQREVMAGSRVGPRAVGPSTDVSEGNGMTLETPEQAIQVVDSLKAAGNAFVKFHGEPDDRDIVFALLREARRVGLPVVGHVPVESVTEVEAVDSGFRSVEHVIGGGQRECWAGVAIEVPKLPDSVALEKACARVAKAYVRNGTWLTPTLVGLRSASIVQNAANRFADVLKYTRTLHRLGITKMLAGSDWSLKFAESDPQFLPGLSAVEELVFLVEAGLAPLEALQAATLNPARFFDATDSLGTVATGKLADLVLLDADPLADITSVLKVRAVIANGRYFDRSALDALDPEGTKPERGLLVVQRQLKEETGVVPNP